MPEPPLRVSVVMATHDRPRRLAEALAALARQDVTPGTFEVIVVDDASGPETAAVLAATHLGPGISLSVVRREVSGGPAGARNDGWRIARAPLVAFTDDDCVAAPDWLSRGLAASAACPGGVIQGWVRPREDERHLVGPYSLSQGVEGLGYFQTCNIFYPRDLLDELEGFDAAAFPGWGGEDTDLGWRAVEAGARAQWAPDVRVYHAVEVVGPVRKLRSAARWQGVALLVKRHPRFRAHMYRGIFWRWSHYALARVLIAAVLPRRWRLLRRWLVAPYVLYLLKDGDGSLRLAGAPYVALHDLVELVSVVRSSVRHRALIV